MTLTPRELSEIDDANASGRQPVVFVHGLWLLASSWDPWRRLFDAAGFATVAPGWPDDPAGLAEGRAHPEVFAGKSVGAVTDHYAEAIGRLHRKPAIVGHSFGGLITQRLAGRGLAVCSVPIDPGPFRGVLPLPFSSLKAAWPVIGNPANRRRSVMLTFEQFRFGFANAVSEREARALYDTFPVPGSGIPLFQAAFANLNPRSETKVITKGPDRGPMKLLSGEQDNIVPWAIANASYRKQSRNTDITEIQEVPGRGHSLVFDSGWEDVATLAADFVRRHTSGPEV
ncbi:alpha-beta hydrolase superfamily lysophospholipase [Amycolatopsis sulphurea]|uniref:Alpha-beta hydrolase superfamily lysophospholipase n=1 Tax=Amycolatopsis sulphurea TaxID=76022 RepID=A0A2A9FF36_9PSEU|nr:alpha/beta hydrolase [Amycolatopsis sulphurea]PFG49120.1 alpha-beta hydrolase superfamily lysophospholipase [Amycolatopsis sulphurea]